MTASPDVTCAADHGRTAVAAAEEQAFAGTDLEELRPLAELVERARRVTTGEWWPGPLIEVRAARRDAESSSARCAADGAVIRIAAAQSTLATLAHELGHVLAGVDHGHDAVFRAAYLDAVAAVTNADPTDRRHDVHVEQLAAGFAATGLDVAARSWAAPRLGGPIAL